MNHWSNHRDTLRRRLLLPPRLLVGSDFDGTLAPITPHPDQTVPAPGICETLGELASLRPRLRLAIISGRSLPDLESRLPSIPGMVLAGNHGLEMAGAGHDWSHPGAAAMQHVLTEMIPSLENLIRPWPGSWIESKGLTLSAHWRNLPAAARSACENALLAYPLPHGMARFRGRCVTEFRPLLPWDKGRALRRILVRSGIPRAASIFIGDDQTDEDAFREISPAGISVRVGAAGTTSHASYCAHDPSDVQRFLAFIRTTLAG